MRSPIDQESGFGLVQALGRLGLPALDLGRVQRRETRRSRDVAAGGGRRKSVRARIVGKQEFTGYWEYLLDEAIFTAPAHPFWGGAGLIGADGKLLGVGSLHVQQVTERRASQDVNMIVPIDLLPPILDDLLAYGRVNRPARPWLGVYSAESGGRMVVADVADSGPAAPAGLRRGDIIARRARFERRKPRRFLSQGLELRPGRRRHPDRDRARWPGHGLARALG